MQWTIKQSEFSVENSYIDIETNLSSDQVVKRLKEITVDLNNSRQTQYHQVFEGQIEHGGGRLIDIYSTPRNRICYDLKFLSENNTTLIRINNTVYDKRQVVGALLKGLLIPLGFIILFLGIVFYENLIGLIFMTILSSLFILPSILYKAKPLTQNEYLSDRHIQTIIKAVDGRPKI
ncbi:MAG: hypothetical protein C0448_07825 [Sphingobacteriaceae bacterium]|nr:hypothetical protein [Sphingobacteriaceae bacterium]